MRRVAASVEPASAAWCSGVKPVRFAELISAPASSRAEIMAVSFLIAAQLRGRRPFEFERVSSPLMSAPALIETMAWVTFPVMTASQTPLCSGEICGTGVDGVDVPIYLDYAMSVDGRVDAFVSDS